MAGRLLGHKMLRRLLHLVNSTSLLQAGHIPSTRQRALRLIARLASRPIASSAFHLICTDN